MFFRLQKVVDCLLECILLKNTNLFFLSCFPSVYTSVEAAGLSAWWVVSSLPMQLKEIIWKNSAYSRLLTVHTIITAAAGDPLLVL